jgi:hypothetical protein
LVKHRGHFHVPFATAFRALSAKIVVVTTFLHRQQVTCRVSLLRLLLLLLLLLLKDLLGAVR